MITYKYQTTSKTILADLYTPVGVYMRLRDLYPQSALMESSDYHDQSNSRSFIGINPMASVAVGHGIATIGFPDGTTEQHEINKEYGTADAIHALIDRIEVTGDDAAVCGLYGYTSFNAVRYFEDIAVKDETQEKNDAPDVLYILYKVVIVFDHHNNMLKVVTLGDASDIDSILKTMNKANVQAYDFNPVGDVRSTLTDDEHKENIRKGIKHCLRGDVFQIVLSRRFIQKFEGDDFKLYRALRSINPSPYLFYFDFGGFRIFGSSPETHCRIEKCSMVRSTSGRSQGENGQCSMYRAYIDPIAGTTKRTGDAEADRKGAEYLRNDPKENAEHYRQQAHLSSAIRRRLDTRCRPHAQGCHDEQQSCGNGPDGSRCLPANHRSLWRHRLLGQLLGVDFDTSHWWPVHRQRRCMGHQS